MIKWIAPHKTFDFGRFTLDDVRLHWMKAILLSLIIFLWRRFQMKIYESFSLELLKIFSFSTILEVFSFVGQTLIFECSSLKVSQQRFPVSQARRSERRRPPRRVGGRSRAAIPATKVRPSGAWRRPEENNYDTQQTKRRRRGTTPN